MKKLSEKRQFCNIFFLLFILLFSSIFFIVSIAAIFVILYKGLIQIIIYPSGNLPFKWIFYSLWGSIYLCFIAIFLATPLGVFLAVLVTEKKHIFFIKCISIFVRVLQGSSSMVVGVLVYLLFVLPWRNFSTFSGGVALSILMLPIIFTCVQNKLEDPFIESLKENALSMGATYSVTFVKVLLPSISLTLISAVLLSLSRALGETSALLFTAFGNSSLQLNPMGPTHSLTLLISEFCTSPYIEYSQAAWLSSFLLIVLILSLHMVSFFFFKSMKFR